jgi:cardiolipin synthase
MGGVERDPRRDGPADESASPFTLANGLTALRIVLAPVFLALYVEGDRLRALAAFAAAAATDVLDGLVARALRQRTRLGAVLDPAADKLLAACALVALAATGRLPAWLPVLVISRDVAQILGAAALRTTHHPVPIAPTRIGKYAMVAIALAVVTALAGDFGAYPRGEAEPFVVTFSLLAAECVAISFVQYFIFFLAAARAPSRPGRPAG